MTKKHSAVRRSLNRIAGRHFGSFAVSVKTQAVKGKRTFPVRQYCTIQAYGEVVVTIDTLLTSVEQ
jgi:hypothetical protein